MRSTRKLFLALSASALAGGAAEAADAVKVEASGEASVVAGAVDGDAKADGDAEIEVKGSTVLDSGLEVGAIVKARIDGQQPYQLYGGGRYSSLLIGGPRGVAPMDADAYIEGASAYARGGFGHLIVGRDQGVARTLAVTSPTIFRAINVNDWRTDLSGLNDVHTVNDFSGYATKITYMPPANFLGGFFGGLQLGISYSPSLRNCGERLCAPEAGFVIAPDGTMLIETSHWEDVVEGALYYQKGVKLGDDRLLLGVGASVVTAQEDARALSQLFGDYEAYSVGLNLGFRGITLGGSVKSTNAGLANLDEEGYLAFDAGVTFRTGEEKGDWGFMLGYGQSEANAIGVNPADPILFRDTQTAQAGVTYFVGRGITIGAAAQFVESTKPASAGGQEEAATVVIESSIKF
ncbi:MAG: porin [Parvularculaceae bacterium]